MSEDRPDPDQLLARVRADEARQARGKLKIFFGAAAGVGKTYAMLEAARAQPDRGRRRRDRLGRDPRPGRDRGAPPRARAAAAPHGRVPRHDASTSSTSTPPSPGARPSSSSTSWPTPTPPAPATPSAGRTSTELLAAGIDVYTTLNVQHLESLNDVVARVTEVPTRETVPDSILEEAAEVELVDLPPDDLIQRLKEGKVYVPEQAGEAVRRFFRKGNLIALRELALRTTAAARRRPDGGLSARPRRAGNLARGRAHPGLRQSRAPWRPASCGPPGGWPPGCTAEWIVVIRRDARPGAALLQRTGTASSRRSAWPSSSARETVTLTGHDVAAEVLTYARRRNVTRIVLGKPARPRWREALFGSVVNELVRQSGDIDVYVITGDREGPQPRTAARAAGAARRLERLRPGRGGRGRLHGGRLALMFPFFAPANLIMVYLLGIVLAAWRLGRGPVDPRLRPQRGGLRFLLRAPLPDLRGLRHRSTWSRSR